MIWGAHDGKTDTLAPQLAVSDLRDLGGILEAIARGEATVSGFFSRVYPVNRRLEIWADIGDR